MRQKRKFTIMIFDDSAMGQAKNIKVTMNTLRLLAVGVLLFIGVSVVSFYFVQQMFSERRGMIAYRHENAELKMQIEGYARQFEDISKKIAALDELEYKVRNLATYQRPSTSIRQIAIGGKEVDLLRDYSAVADRREKEFFDELNETLLTLGTELDQRESRMTELVDFLEEQKLIMRSTPSIWPTRGWISSEFGYRISPFSGRRVFHEGLDIATRYGAPIKAGAKGIVIFSGRKPGYGYVITIDHGYGYVTRYAHCSRLLMKVGDRVDKGMVVAKVGNTGRSTGPHVHYEVLVNGIPVNPMKFIVDGSDVFVATLE